MIRTAMENKTLNADGDGGRPRAFPSLLFGWRHSVRLTGKMTLLAADHQAAGITLQASQAHPP